MREILWTHFYNPKRSTSKRSCDVCHKSKGPKAPREATPRSDGRKKEKKCLSFCLPHKVQLMLRFGFVFVCVPKKKTEEQTHARTGRCRKERPKTTIVGPQSYTEQLRCFFAVSPSLCCSAPLESLEGRASAEELAALHVLHTRAPLHVPEDSQCIAAI